MICCIVNLLNLTNRGNKNVLNQQQQLISDGIALIFSLTWLRKHDKGHGVMIEGLVNQSLLAIKGFIPVRQRDDMQMLVCHSAKSSWSNLHPHPLCTSKHREDE